MNHRNAVNIGGNLVLTECCPFCGNDTALLNLKTPEGCNHFGLMGINTKLNTVSPTSSSIVDVKICPKCRAMFLFNSSKD